MNMPPDLLIPLRDVNAQLNLSSPLATHTLRQWIKKGCALPNGRRIFLRAQRIGKNWHTSPAWIADFLRNCNGGPANDS